MKKSITLAFALFIGAISLSSCDTPVEQKEQKQQSKELNDCDEWIKVPLSKYDSIQGNISREVNRCNDDITIRIRDKNGYVSFVEF